MDGNMARRILRDHPDVLAEECCVPVEFVKGFYVIWVALASRLPICPLKFQNYCDRIKAVYLENVSWYPLSPTLHKVLEHGSQVLELFPDSLTSGMLSEEPAEASNKDVKKFQISHARQDNPDHRNIDVFHRLCERSDPQILNYYAHNRQIRRKSSEVFPKDVLQLCKDSDQIALEMNLLE